MKGLRRIWKAAAFLLIVALPAAVLPPGTFGSLGLPAEARTWHVHDDLANDPAADFTTIQDPVNAADVGPFQFD